MLVQGMDKGILFCTYNLLIARTTKKNELEMQLTAQSYKESMQAACQDMNIHERQAHNEAARAEAEFGACFSKL